MVKSWKKVGKSDEKLEKVGKCGENGKSVEKWVKRGEK